MNKIILTFISLLFIALAALLVIPSFIDWGRYKDQITGQIADATGYQVQIKGDMQAALLPYPHVNLNDVRFDSADVEGPVAFEGSMDSASVALAFMPLLKGTVAVSEINLVKPQISIQEQDYDAPASPNGNEDDIIDDEGGQGGAGVQLDRFYIENALIQYTPLNGDVMSISIPALELKANTLYGPYIFDGQVVYGDLPIAFEGKAGEYSKTQAIPLTVSMALNSMAVAYSGVVDISGDVPDYQGEVNINTKSLLETARQFNVENLPLQDQAIKLSGLLTGSTQTLKLENGVFALGNTDGSVQLSADGLETENKVVNLDLNFASGLNLDALLSQNKTGSKQSGQGEASAAKQNYRYMPETIEIPAGVRADVKISAPQVIYKGKAMDTVTLGATLKDGEVEASMDIVAIPGGGSLKSNATLSAESTSRNGATGTIVFANPALSFNSDFNVQSLKNVAAQWLQLIEPTVFDNPHMPGAISGTIKGRVQGSGATLNSSAMTVGQYNLRALSFGYINSAQPQINLSVDDFEGATVKASGTLDKSQGVQVSLSHPNAASFLKTFDPNRESSPAMEQSFTFDGLILRQDDIVNVKNMLAKIGKVNATGSIIANMGGEIPDIQAELAFGTLDIRALMGGKPSSASASTQSGRSTDTSSVRSSSAPWTRDAIDTSFLRAFKLALDAKAQKLVHGPWEVNEPVIDIVVKNGVLDIQTIAGGLFDGTVTMSGKVEAREEGQPLSAALSVNAQTVDLNRLVQASLAQQKQRVQGTGSFTMDLTASGLSSSALIYSLNGDGSIETSELTVYGINLAKVTEALSDESLSDLANVVQGAFQGGQTRFAPVSHSIMIREGTMPVNDFRLVSETAQIIANGEVSFARWLMDVTNTVDFIGQYDDLPSVEMTIKGPLNAPQQNVASDVLRSFIMNKYGGKVRDKIQEAIGDKLGADSPASGIINNLLGLPQQQKQAPAANDNAEPQPVEEPQAQDQTPQQSPEEQLIRGLLSQFGR